VWLIELVDEFIIAFFSHSDTSFNFLRCPGFGGDLGRAAVDGAGR
jgi:hypothetical protein